MTAFLAWYFIITILGWLTFPLVYALFPALSDRGYTLARAAGLLIWAYIFWLFASLGIAQNDTVGMLLAFAVLIGLSIWSLVNRRSEIVNFVQSNKSLIIAAEILFFVAFAFLAFVRSANPELMSTEKPMELAFINGILRSPTFPPQDPWLSGYAISYYYFGYVMTAMLAKLSGINGSMAHNLMTALIFGLGAIGSYGILYNLLDRRPQTADRPPSTVLGLSLLAPLFLLLVSNFGALLEVLHRRGIGWAKDPATGEWTGTFWKWLDMKELSMPPAEPLGWMPDRYLWWWRSSRVIQDYDMLGNHREVIDEFPFFSFLLGDLHPHVLAIPFGLLAIAVALNLFLGGWRGRIDLPWGARLHISPTGFLFSALVLGGLAFLNTWDILVFAALIVSAYVLWRAREDGWNWSRFEDLFLLGLPLGILSLLMYFPFYLGFSSQAGGILPNFMYPTRGMHLWVMWGTLFIPIFAFLIYSYTASIPLRAYEPADSIKPNWKLGISLGLGITFSLAILTLLTGWLGSIVEKPFVDALLASQNMTASQFLGATTLRRLNHIGSLTTLLAILIPTLAFLFSSYEKRDTSNENDSPQNSSHITRPSLLGTHHSPSAFVLVLITLGILLILAPEFVYLRDQFGYRINTVFKFYYQAWMLLSVVAAFSVSILLQNLQGKTSTLFRIVIALVIFCGLLYPSLSLVTKTDKFKPVHGFTLDDFDRFRRDNTDEAAAIEWLRSAPPGVIVEAVGDSYQPSFSRIATYTGLQTVLGWRFHEAQWRGGFEPQGTRSDDVTRLYATARWEEAQAIIERYNIRYIVIGTIERVSMQVNEEKFRMFLKPVFEQGNVVIYEVP